MIKFTVDGSTRSTEEFLRKMMAGDLYSNLDRFAQEGVNALKSVTPRDDGVTAEAWGYEIVKKGEQYAIWWTNSNEINGFNVAIGLQYGHGTGTGGFVQGYDYINPALRPIFDRIAADVWKEVQKA